MSGLFGYKQLGILILYLSIPSCIQTPMYDFICTNCIATWIIQFLEYQFVINVLNLQGFHLCNVDVDYLWHSIRLFLS